MLHCSGGDHENARFFLAYHFVHEKLKELLDPMALTKGGVHGGSAGG